MQVTNLEYERNTVLRSLDRSKTAGSNYLFDDLSTDERKIFEDAASAIRHIETLFVEKWLPVGRAVALARECAKRINQNNAYLQILQERGISIDGPTCSHLLRIMDNLDAVLRWYGALPANKRREWTHPRSVVRHCDLFNPPKPSAPKRPTRLDNALEENRALKIEVESYRRSVGDDCGFSRKDRPAAIADVIVSALSEHKQRALAAELVRRVGTQKQREAFGLGGDDQPASPFPAANGAAL
jgi:hypothetical protein